MIVLIPTASTKFGIPSLGIITWSIYSETWESGSLCGEPLRWRGEDGGIGATY